MRSFILACAFSAGLFVSANAEAVVAVAGNGPAYSCYRMALAGRDHADALAPCNLALETQALSRRTRAETLVNRGIIYLNRGAFSIALRDFDEAARLRPSLAEAYTHRGIALSEMGDQRGAVEAITHGLSLNPMEPAKAYFSRAIAFEELGDVRAAYQDYRQAAQLAPDWELARSELARFQVRN